MYRNLAIFYTGLQSYFLEHIYCIQKQHLKQTSNLQLCCYCKSIDYKYHIKVCTNYVCIWVLIELLRLAKSEQINSYIFIRNKFLFFIQNIVEGIEKNRIIPNFHKLFFFRFLLHSQAIFFFLLRSIQTRHPKGLVKAVKGNFQRIQPYF